MTNDTKRDVLMPPPRAAEPDHAAGFAVATGAGHEHSAEAVSIFTLGVPSQVWSGLVMAVADAQDCAARNDVASTTAVDALEDHLTGWGEYLDFTSRSWQEPVAQALASAFERANANVAALMAGVSDERTRGVGLTAAVFLGDWLCVAHTGDCRVYRLSRRGLEELLLDESRLRTGRTNVSAAPPRSLGLGVHVTPVIRFFRLDAGDMVLVGSDGVWRNLQIDAIGRLMVERHSLTEIANALAAAATGHGPADDVSLCLARTGRLHGKMLPDPASRSAAAQVAQPVMIPRNRRWVAKPARVLRMGAVVGAVALAGGAAAAWQLRRRDQAVVDAVAFADTVRLAHTDAAAVLVTPATPPIEVPAVAAVRADTAAAIAPADVVPAPPTRAASHDSAKLVSRTRREPKAGDEVPDEGRLIEEARAHEATEAVIASAAAAAERRQTDDKRRADSIAAERERLAAEQRDAERREAQAQSDREAAIKIAAAERARADERAHAEKLAAGKDALVGWMNGVVSSANAGNAKASVLAAGPADFVGFVRRKQPRLTEAHLLTTTVTDQAGEATAEWVASWRTEFGTATSRHMKATATIAPDGDTWQLRSWRITDGAP